MKTLQSRDSKRCWELLGFTCIATLSTLRSNKPFIPTVRQGMMIKTKAIFMCNFFCLPTTCCYHSLFPDDFTDRFTFLNGVSGLLLLLDLVPARGVHSLPLSTIRSASKCPVCFTKNATARGDLFPTSLKNNQQNLSFELTEVWTCELRRVGVVRC